MHPSYYHQAHACILVFDATRKNTYKNLANWYEEMRKYRPSIPCICAVNKIDGKKSKLNYFRNVIRNGGYLNNLPMTYNKDLQEDLIFRVYVYIL